MKEEIFRKKSLEKMQSPEVLNDYLRVSNPGVWLFLASVIILLAGACIWGFFGRIERTTPVTVYVEAGTASFTAEAAPEIRPGMSVRFDETVGEVAGITQDGAACVCEVRAEQLPGDGIYAGTLVTERIRPMSFILN